MKGSIFTEFIDFVESQYGVEMVDAIIDGCELSTGGAYTAVSTYPAAELRRLVTALSMQLGVAEATLLYGFGRRMCERLAIAHAEYFRRAAGLFDLLASLDDHIHLDVLKLHPDAELPSFRVASRQADLLCLDYRSRHRLEDFALGMIDGAARYFGEPVAVARETLSDTDGSYTRFTLRRLTAKAA